jgi:hypothetical protein
MRSTSEWIEARSVQLNTLHGLLDYLPFLYQIANIAESRRKTSITTYVLFHHESQYQRSVYHRNTIRMRKSTTIWYWQILSHTGHIIATGRLL